MELIDISPGDGSVMFDLNLFIISSHFRATLYRHLGPAQRRSRALTLWGPGGALENRPAEYPLFAAILRVSRRAGPAAPPARSIRQLELEPADRRTRTA